MMRVTRRGALQPVSASSARATPSLYPPSGELPIRKNTTTTMMARRRSQRRPMDGACRAYVTDPVKVLYTLDASAHTMIARAAGRIPVRVARQGGTNAVLGRVALKACLDAVCLASPELLLDRSKDYIVYAVDPVESQRAALLRSPGRASPSKAQAAPVLVGKGFFSAHMENAADEYATGYVRTEARYASAFSSDEEAEDDGAGADVLEIVLQLKAASPHGRAQYQSRLRGLTSQTEAPASTSREALGSTPSALVPTATQNAQLLQVLRAIQAHQGSLSPEQQAQIVALLNVAAGALPQQQPPPIEGPAEHTHAPRAKRSASAQRDIRAEWPRVCYNCGTTNASTWRILTLPAGVQVHYPASERPPSDAVPLTWTPEYPDTGPVTTHSEARWQACNPCGLYFGKYHVSRPDYVRNFVARPPRDERRAKKRTKADVARDENRPPSSPPLTPRKGRPTPSRPSAFTSPNTAFGLPSAMMNSSPNTMLHTLMSETDLDFEERHPSGTYPTPGALVRVKASPVRRSPRKRPAGTQGEVNPYASTQRARSSPARAASGTQPTTPRRSALTSPGAQGPFMGLPLDEDADTDAFGCPASPSEARSTRAARAKRTLRTPSRTQEDWAPPAPPSPTLGLERPLRVEPGMKELFGGGEWLAAWDAAQPQAAAEPAQAAVIEPPAEAPPAEAPPPAGPPARQPPAATVEDASSSCSESPAALPEDDGVDLIEDPYGILAACGLGVQALGNGDGGAAPSGGISADMFNQIELHSAPAFAQQLDAFTQGGHLGVAAHSTATADAAVARSPHVRAFGSAKGEETDFSALLDDPSVQAMLASIEQPAIAP